MRIDIITIFPEFFKSTLDFSILKKAQENNIVDIQIHNLRDYSENKQRSVDDYQFGGGAGMVMNIQPIYKCIEEVQFNIYSSIRGLTKFKSLNISSFLISFNFFNSLDLKVL